MKSASLKAGRFNKLFAASFAVLTGCSSSPLGLGFGAGAGTKGNVNLVVDSLAEAVDLAQLPALATREAQAVSLGAAGSAASSLAVGIKGDRAYADPARQRTVVALGLGVMQRLEARASDRAQLAASSSASGSADASGRANGNATGKAKPDGWVFQRIDFKPTRIEVHQTANASGSVNSWISIPVNSTASIDLVKLNEDGAAQLLAAAKLEAGSYDRIRLWGADTRRARESDANTYLALDADGTAHTGVYKLPGQVLTVNATFDVKADAATTLTFSFDPGEAMHRAGKRLILEPSSLKVETQATAVSQAN